MLDSVTTMAGNPGNNGISDGFGTNVLFLQVFDVKLSSRGVLYIVDSSAHSIRRMNISTGTFHR